MTALVADRVQTARSMKRIRLTLASGQHVYQGSKLGTVPGSGTVVEVTATNRAIVLGTAGEECDATSAAKLVTVEFDREIWARWFSNHTSGAVAATDLGMVCNSQDDNTVTMLGAGRSRCGIVWGVDSVKGVLVEQLGSMVAPSPLDMGTLPDPVSADVIVTAASIINGGKYLLPALAANSTVTLPVTGVADMTQITVIADGSQGAYTTTYRYGTTAISAALTASRAHTAILTKNGTMWAALTGVAPS